MLCVSLGRFLIKWNRDEALRERHSEAFPESFCQQEETRYAAESFSTDDTPERVSRKGGGSR